MNVRDEVDGAVRLSQQLEDLVVRKGTYPSGDRNVLLILYWALLFDYYKGILWLLSSQHFGSAFALIRPVVEATIRAHVVVMGSEEDVRSIKQDEYRVNFERIGSEIDKAFGLDGLMENFLKQAREALHSYTHSGALQLGRRLDGDEIKPHYSEGEIYEVINVTSSAAFMVTNLLTKHFGLDEEWHAATRVFAEWGRHSEPSGAAALG